MFDFDFIINNEFFKKISLKSGDILFDEGDIDNNLYIVISGSLVIQKYTTTEKNEQKQLAILKKGEIFGEGALKNSTPKQVRIVAQEECVLYKIDAKEGIKSLISKFPNEGIQLLNEIIDIGNKRLLESNFLITSNYQISKKISEISTFDNKNLFLIIDEFQKIIGSEYILYLEKNPVMNNFITLKYDTRKVGKMLNLVVELNDDEINLFDLKEEGIELDDDNFIKKLKNKNEILGFFIIGNNEQAFSEGQKKAIYSISVLIAGFIRSKLFFEEQKNIEFNNN